MNRRLWMTGYASALVDRIRSRSEPGVCRGCMGRLQHGFEGQLSSHVPYKSPYKRTANCYLASRQRGRNARLEVTMSVRIALRLMAVVFLSTAVTTAARAADNVKVAIGQIDAWANQAPTLGKKAGIFQKHGIDLETFGTQGAGETLQAVIAGSADIGIGIGTAGAMRAFARGAPVRVIAAAYVGVGDQYWYVPTNSPLKSLADATEKNTLSYSTN